MLSPEQNDVDISKLFNWGKEVFIVDDYGKTISKCFMRVVGDAELNRSKVLALRRSADLRKKLSDVNSDESFAYIIPMELLEKDGIINYILSLKVREVAREANKELNVAFPKEPRSDASQEEQEKYQALVDEYPAKYETALRNKIEELMNKEISKLNDLEMEELYILYKKILTNSLCEAELNNALTDYMIYFGTYKDKKYKNKFFNTYEEFSKLPTSIKEQLIAAYESLEINADELKK